MKHVEKNDFPVLVDALGIPPVFRWGIFTRLGPLTCPLTVVTIFMFFFFGVQCIIYNIYIYIYRPSLFWISQKPNLRTVSLFWIYIFSIY